MVSRWRNVAGAMMTAWLAGCACSHANSPPPRSLSKPGNTTEEELVADIARLHRHHRPSAVLVLFALSLDRLGLPDEELVHVERVQQNLLDKIGPAGQAERHLMSVLAEGVVDSRIDKARIADALARLSTTSAATRDARVDALNELHRILTPAQRAALIHELDARRMLWREANAEERILLPLISDDIGLTPEQLAKLGGQVRPPEKPAAPEAEVNLRELEDGFRADTFDARMLFQASGTHRDAAVRGSQRLSRYCEAVTPLLTEAQRWRLASLLREWGAHDGMPVVVR